MKINRLFNTMRVSEYIHIIDHHTAYEDFNTLGLYRSLLENEQLSLEDKLVLRNHAHGIFKKQFDFLQLKDPLTYVEVTYLGQELTKGDEQQIWRDISRFQEKVLEEKRISHRNFGD